jgi:hypothetical protein
MSQVEWILWALRRRPLTPMEALKGCGCFRLAARIQELRKEGHLIAADRAEQDGKVFARYTLIKEKKNGRKSNKR